MTIQKQSVEYAKLKASYKESFKIILNILTFTVNSKNCIHIFHTINVFWDIFKFFSYRFFVLLFFVSLCSMVYIIHLNKKHFK